MTFIMALLVLRKRLLEWLGLLRQLGLLGLLGWLGLLGQLGLLGLLRWLGLSFPSSPSSLSSPRKSQ